MYGAADCPLSAFSMKSGALKKTCLSVYQEKKFKIGQGDGEFGADPGSESLLLRHKQLISAEQEFSVC